ncbi:MAG: hypothetical protein AAF799_48215 [Myxococcota bacterium]
MPVFVLAVGLGACGAITEARPGGISGTEDEPGDATGGVDPSNGSDDGTEPGTSDGSDETGDDAADDSSSGGEPEEPMQEATFEARIASGLDDVEERDDGSMYASSSDLELAIDSTHDTSAVGMRFVGLPIPAGATIDRAYVQFATEEVQEGRVSLVIEAQDSDDAAPFADEVGDLTGRPRTDTAVPWQPVPWDEDDAETDDQRTPELAGLLQEVVDRPGWSAGNDVVFIVTGSGTRTAHAYDGSPSQAPLLHIEYSWYGDLPPGDDPPDDGPATIETLDTTVDYAGNGTIEIDRPDSEPGDLLVLFFHRTDDYLPLRLDGWTKLAECLKQDNGQPECMTEDDCLEWNDDEAYCDVFEEGPSRDLGTAVFYRSVDFGEPDSYTWDPLGSHAAWAIMTSLRGADANDPLRSWTGESNDGDSNSVFPPTYGKSGDILLLSQGFDDTAAEEDFLPPLGTTALGYIAGADEAGYLFSQHLEMDGDTEFMSTEGEGGPNAKDVLLSLTIKPEGGR